MAKTKMERNVNPGARLSAGGYRVTKSSGPAKKQSRRAISPKATTKLGTGSANGRIPVRSR